MRKSAVQNAIEKEAVDTINKKMRSSGVFDSFRRAPPVSLSEAVCLATADFLNLVKLN